MRIFGRKKKEQPYSGPTLEDTSDSMEKRVQVLRTRVQECEKELAQIRQTIKTSRGAAVQMAKQRAVQVMKRRNMYRTQLDNLLGQQFNVEQMQFNQQGIQDTINTVAAMKQAHKVQVQQLKQLNVNEVEDMMDDMQDLMMDTDEINEIMSRNYGVDDIDEDALEAELADLDDELLEENLQRGTMEAPSYLPAAPPQRQPEEEIKF